MRQAIAAVAFWLAATVGGVLPVLPASADSAGDVKPIIQGLVDRKGALPAIVLPVVHAYVVRVPWADLQPGPGAGITGRNAIDQAITRVRQPDYLAANVVLKLRVLAGINAPEWAKNLGGLPIPYTNGVPGSGVVGTIGRFWTLAFGRAYDDLQAKLAAKYDTVPEIREVSVSRCSTLFDETFARQFGDPANVSNLRAAGYTTAADQQCIADSITAHRVWTHTTSDVAFAPFPDPDHPSDAHDIAYPISVMTTCRAVLGRRCGLQNDSLSVGKLGNDRFRALYAAMSALGPPLTLQTASMHRLGDETQVLTAAVSMGANSVELPAGYPNWSPSLLMKISLELAANPVPH